jgi:hypothetical protein
MVERVNSTIIYYKNFYKCHNVPLMQQYDNLKNKTYYLKNRTQSIYISTIQNDRPTKNLKKYVLQKENYKTWI